MRETIHRALQALNAIEVKGERNLDLLLYAIQQMKDVQSQLMQKVQEGADNGSHDN